MFQRRLILCKRSASTVASCWIAEASEGEEMKAAAGKLSFAPRDPPPALKNFSFLVD
jgi:hypothetical protein